MANGTLRVYLFAVKHPNNLERLWQKQRNVMISLQTLYSEILIKTLMCGKLYYAICTSIDSEFFNVTFNRINSDRAVKRNEQR